jgi:hypothetical protein
LAADRGVDAEAFLAAVTAAGAGALAAIPLTLDLLLRLYQRDGRLADGAPTLFDQGVLVLADEPDEDRRSSELRVGSAQQRVAVAARFSATLVLCGKAAVWSGGVGDLPETDVPNGAFVGGSELGPAGPFDVTPDLVAATLDTALFSSRGTDRLGLAHATFASYLAARHLVAHQMPEQQLRSLLVNVNESGRAGIPPPLRETAAWVVALDPEKMAWLADVDPYNIAVHAAVVANLGVREFLVRRLLEQAETVALVDRPWARPRWSLSHPGLADQLRSVLVAAVADDRAVRPSREQVHVAIQVAREGGAASLTDELCDVAADREWDGYLRSWAVRAAADVDRARAALRLRELLEELDLDADPDDELRGEVLAACWPAHLSVDEFLAALAPPRNPDLFGAYWLFRQSLMEQLSEHDLPAVVGWGRKEMRARVQASTAESREPASESSTAEGPAGTSTEPDGNTGVFTPAELPEHEAELLDAIIDRALTGFGGSGTGPICG